MGKSKLVEISKLDIIFANIPDQIFDPSFVKWWGEKILIETLHELKFA